MLVNFKLQSSIGYVENEVSQTNRAVVLWEGAITIFVQQYYLRLIEYRDFFAASVRSDLLHNSVNYFFGSSVAQSQEFWFQDAMDRFVFVNPLCGLNNIVVVDPDIFELVVMLHIVFQNNHGVFSIIVLVHLFSVVYEFRALYLVVDWDS